MTRIAGPWPIVLSASLLAILVLGGCAASPGLASPGRTIAPGTTAEDFANGLTPPPGDAVRFDDATISDDGTSVNLAFVGGKEYNPTDPCTYHYFGWAREIDGTLEAKIVNDTPVWTGPQVLCSDVGYSRQVTIGLASPFLGARVHDVAGYVHFVRRPDGIVDLAKLPAGWTLVVERDVEESPTGRWQRTWTRGGAPTEATSKGKIDFYQAFGGPASVSGGEEVRSVMVNGTPATLFRQAEDGELVLVWMLDGDGLALVVNETEFPVDRAIELAESAAAP